MPLRQDEELAQGGYVREAGFSLELGRLMAQRRPSASELLRRLLGPGTGSGTGGSEDKLGTQKNTERKMRQLFR